MFHWLALRWGRVPNRPVGLLLSNIRCCPAFVDAVIPLPQILFHLGNVTVSGNSAGLARTLERAGKNKAEGAMREIVSDLCCALLASRSQRYIGPAGMSTGKTPF